MHEETISAVTTVTGGRLSETDVKHLIVETMYLRPGNRGNKWSSGYGPFRFWFSMDKHRKVRLNWDSNATDEAIKAWAQVAQAVYGDRYISPTD